MDDDLKKQQAKMLSRMLFIMGNTLLLAGLIGLVATAQVSSAVGMDEKTVQMISGAFMVAGLGDFLVAKFFQSKT